MENINVPDCCLNCKNYDTWIDEYCPPVPYCIINIYIPCKKKSCKRQEPYIEEIKNNS